MLYTVCQAALFSSIAKSGKHRSGMCLSVHLSLHLFSNINLVINEYAPSDSPGGAYTASIHFGPSFACLSVSKANLSLYNFVEMVRFVRTSGSLQRWHLC